MKHLKKWLIFWSMELTPIIVLFAGLEYGGLIAYLSSVAASLALSFFFVAVSDIVRDHVGGAFHEAEENNPQSAPLIDLTGADNLIVMVLLLDSALWPYSILLGIKNKFKNRNSDEYGNTRLALTIVLLVTCVVVGFYIAGF